MPRLVALLGCVVATLITSGLRGPSLRSICPTDRAPIVPAEQRRIAPEGRVETPRRAASSEWARRTVDAAGGPSHGGASGSPCPVGGQRQAPVSPHARSPRRDGPQLRPLPGAGRPGPGRVAASCSSLRPYRYRDITLPTSQVAAAALTTSSDRGVASGSVHERADRSGQQLDQAGQARGVRLHTVPQLCRPANYADGADGA